MRCFDSQAAAYVVVIDTSKLEVLHMQKVTLAPTLLATAADPCAIFFYDKVAVTQLSCTTYKQVAKLSPETLELSSFDVVNVLQLGPNQVLLVLAEELVVIAVGSSSSVLSRLSLVSSLDFRDSPRINSAGVTGSLVLVVATCQRVQ